MSVCEYLGYLRRVETPDVYVRLGCVVSCDWGMLRWIAGVTVLTALYRCPSKLPCQNVHLFYLCTPYVPSTGICWAEDGPERTETCSHTGVLMIVYVIVF